MRVATVVAWVIAFASPPAAGAAEPPSFALSYQAPEGAGCPTEDAVRAAVTGELGYDPWDPVDDGASPRIGVTIRAARGGVRGRVEMRATDGRHLGARELEAPSCAELAGALTLAIAVAIDPLRAVAPPPPKYPEPWASNSDPVYDDRPQVITYNRFFQHSMKFLHDHDMLKDIVMTYGVSSAMYVATNAYGLKQGSFISSAAWQCIGFETGAASGAQLGSGKRAWTIAGDGGFMMVCQALSTLARNKLNAVMFVMSNQVYAIEQVYVDMSAFEPGPQHTFDAFDILPKWDYLALAKAFGAEGMRVETIDQLNAALGKIRKIKDRPVLVEVVIPQKDLPGQMRRLGSE